MVNDNRESTSIEDVLTEEEKERLDEAREETEEEEEKE